MMGICPSGCLALLLLLHVLFAVAEINILLLLLHYSDAVQSWNIHHTRCVAFCYCECPLYYPCTVVLLV